MTSCCTGVRARASAQGVEPFQSHYGDDIIEGSRGTSSRGALQCPNTGGAGRLALQIRDHADQDMLPVTARDRIHVQLLLNAE